MKGKEIKHFNYHKVKAKIHCIYPISMNLEVRMPLLQNLPTLCVVSLCAL